MKQIYANGDGTAGDKFLKSGGIGAVTGVIQGAFNLGGEAIKADTSVKVAQSTNDSNVKIHESDNQARVKMAEILSTHTKEITTTVVTIAVVIALLVYLLKSPRR